MSALALLKLLLKASIRIEKKLDELLKLSLAESRTQKGVLVQLEPLNYPTQGACPLCQKPVVYVPMTFQDLPDPVLVRTCGCEAKTNQLPIQGDEQ
jgi:hypothetical protein